MDPLWIFLLGTLVVLGGILGLRLHAFLALILGAFLVACLTPANVIAEQKGGSAEIARQPAIERVAREFGNSAQRIGILIALATIVGQCLLETGGADRVVRSALDLLGEKRAPLALLLSGFTLGFGVFFETVFLLMVPLAKALHFVTGRNYLLYVLSIIAGATMTHSLVPPTPGPLFVAVALKVNIGLAIMVGGIVGAITATIGWTFAHFLDRRSNILLRERGEISLEKLAEAAPPEKLPPLWLAILPVIIPITLIISASVLARQGVEKSWLQTLGQPTIALGIACVIGLATLLWQGKSRVDVFSGSIGRSLEKAGTIILIISAGGAFGGVLQQSGIGARIKELALTYQLPILPLAWGLTALLRTAHGSSTVAKFTTV
jgi:GntP family gluconate:H+ symporter